MSSTDTPGESDEARRLYRDVLESVGEGALSDKEAIGVADAFRIANKLDVSIVETPHEWVFNYSVRDVEGLGKLERADWQRIRSEWQKWHREYEALSPAGMIAWAVAAAAMWFLLNQRDGVLTLASSFGVQPPTWTATVTGYVLLLGVVLFASRMLATVTSAAHWDTYSAGYEEGLRQGINRALMITPEREREMWDEISKADLARGHLDYAAKSTGVGYD
jgi:hypothetical protein